MADPAPVDLSKEWGVPAAASAPAGGPTPGSVDPGAGGAPEGAVSTQEAIGGVRASGGRPFYPMSVGDMGMLAGQLAGGPGMRALSKVAPYVAKLPLGLMRVILGAVGDEVGTQLEGGTPGVGAAQGLVGGILGEAPAIMGKGALKAAEKVGLRESAATVSKRTADAAASQASFDAQQANLAARQSYQNRIEQVKAQVTGERQQQGQVMAQQLGDLAGKVAPALQPQAGPTSAAQLSEIGTFPQTARRTLGTAQAKSLESTEQMIGGPDTTIRVPSLAKGGPSLTPDEENMVRRQLGLKKGEPIPGLGGAQVSGGVAGGDRVTLREATEALTDLGHSVWRGKESTAVPLPKHVASRLYGQMRQEIVGELSSYSPEAAATWDQGRAQFSVGNALVNLFRKEKIFDRSSDSVNLDPRAVQQIVRSNAQWLRDRMMPQDFEALRQAVYKGGDIATQMPSLAKARSLAVAKVPKPATISPEAMAPSAAAPKPIFSLPELGQIYLDSVVQRSLAQQYEPR